MFESIEEICHRPDPPLYYPRNGMGPDFSYNGSSIERFRQDLHMYKAFIFDTGGTWLDVTSLDMDTPIDDIGSLIQDGFCDFLRLIRQNSKVAVFQSDSVYSDFIRQIIDMLGLDSKNFFYFGGDNKKFINGGYDNDPDALLTKKRYGVILDNINLEKKDVCVIADGAGDFASTRKENLAYFEVPYFPHPCLRFDYNSIIPKNNVSDIKALKRFRKNSVCSLIPSNDPALSYA